MFIEPGLLFTSHFLQIFIMQEHGNQKQAYEVFEGLAFLKLWSVSHAKAITS